MVDLNDGLTPLLQAIGQGLTCTAQVLLKAGADPCFFDLGGDICRGWVDCTLRAICCQQPKMLRALLACEQYKAVGSVFIPFMLVKPVCDSNV